MRLNVLLSSIRRQSYLLQCPRHKSSSKGLTALQFRQSLLRASIASDPRRGRGRWPLGPVPASSAEILRRQSALTVELPATFNWLF